MRLCDPSIYRQWHTPELTQSMRRQSDPEMEVRSLDEGDYVFREGDYAYEAFLLVRGSVEISIVVDGKKRVLDTIEEGRVFGEFGIISNMPRSADALCLTECHFKVLTGRIFEQKLDAMDPFMTFLVRWLIDRVRVLSRTKWQD